MYTESITQLRMEEICWWKLVEYLSSDVLLFISLAST